VKFVQILVINAGSSSIKFSVFASNGGELRSLLEGEVSGIGSNNARLKARDASERDLAGGSPEVKAETPVEALRLVADVVNRVEMPPLSAVGYRVVHPGAKLKDHVRITEEVLTNLKEAEEFAPLHDPAAITIIRESMGRYPNAVHYACFDTVFHETMPEAASTYAIPAEYREHGVRRYGFHGLSCESVLRQMRTGAIRLPQRMAIAHLGSGCSVTALLAGRSVDTTMGLTPTGGVVMGTRPGDLDPGLLLYLLRKTNGDREGALAQLDRMLNFEAGMVGLTSLPNDMKAVREAAAKGDAKAKLAIAVFTRSVKKAIGASQWIMGGLDAVVFSGGIGENDWQSRAEILEGLEDVGIKLDKDLNAAERRGSTEETRAIHAPDSRSKVFVIRTREDLVIAAHVERLSRELS
jgi:acetate kinase